MIEFKWEISEMDVLPARKGFENVVRAIHWKYNAIDGEERLEMTGTVPLALPVEGREYLPLAEITEAWCIEQISAVVDVEGLQELLTATFERSRDASQPQKVRAPFAEIARLPEGRRVPDPQRDKAAFEAGLKRVQEAEEARAAAAEEERRAARSEAAAKEPLP